MLAQVSAARQDVLPEERGELEILPGVGQYMASAVLLLCFGRNEPLLDSNMARVLERVFGPRHLADIRFDPFLQSLAGAVVQSENPIDMNWAILDLAALVCTLRRPPYAICPLNSICQTAQAQSGGHVVGISERAS